MKKILLTVFLFFIFYFLFFAIPVSAKCTLSSTDTTPGCPANQTCRYDQFYQDDPKLAGQVCSDLSIDNCWCTPNDKNYVPPAVNIPQFPAATTGSPTTNASVPGFAYAQGSCSGGSAALDSRPNECATCTKTDKMTQACATTFAANDDIPYMSHQSDFFCARPDGSQQAYIKGSWSGTITVDASEAKIPFVGKKGAESEQKYLADYFEGTAYYSPQIDLKKCQENYDEECQKQMADIFLRAGVWPKLAPTDLQDDLKRKMIGRAEKGEIHNYKVEYGGQSAVLTEFATHLKPQRKDFISPDVYQGNLDNWRASDNGKWSTLWTAVPMFSREDTPGSVIITPKINPEPQDSVNPRFPNLVEKVPHVARLYEVTQTLQKLLVPFQNNNNVILGTQSEAWRTPESTTDSGQVPTEVGIPIDIGARMTNNDSQVLGASTGCPASYLQGKIENIRTENGQIKYGLRISRTQAGQAAYPGTIGDIAIYGPNGYHMENLWKDQEMYFDSTYAGADAFMPTPDSLGTLSNYSWNITKDYQNCKEQLTVKADVNAPPVPPKPPVPSCANILAGAPGANACKPQEVKENKNPNDADTLCCGKASIALSATDTFANQQYDQSEKCMNDCTQSETVCEKRCNKGLSKPVSRSVEIGLYHPFLRQIWEQTTKSTAGIFNIFKVGDDYGELPAITKINYSYTPTGKSANQASPQIGDFYFPYLGSIQEAKEFVINLLNPGN